jgi:hypothetical protein
MTAGSTNKHDGTFRLKCEYMTDDQHQINRGDNSSPRTAIVSHILTCDEFGRLLGRERGEGGEGDGGGSDEVLGRPRHYLQRANRRIEDT